MAGRRGMTIDDTMPTIKRTATISRSVKPAARGFIIDRGEFAMFNVCPRTGLCGPYARCREQGVPAIAYCDDFAESEVLGMRPISALIPSPPGWPSAPKL